MNLIRVSTADDSLEKSVRPRSVTDILLDKKQKQFKICVFNVDKSDDEDNKNLMDITGKNFLFYIFKKFNGWTMKLLVQYRHEVAINLNSVVFILYIAPPNVKNVIKS